jgi:transposase
MHIDIVPNRGSSPTVLLRETFRDGARVCKRTLANLSSLSTSQVEALRAILKGEAMAPVTQTLEILRSRPHGHVQAVSVAMQRLGLSGVLGGKSCPERDRVLAMIASRIIEPSPKLATTRWWHTSTLAAEFGVVDADEDDLYAAMDWLLQRQESVQKKLAARHLHEDGLVLYDLSSSYFEGATCPLARRGYSRDGKPGSLQVNYGLMTDARGCPVAVSVHEGNTADSLTFIPAVQQLRQALGVQRLVMVGDRGMVSSKAIAELREMPGMGWITALKSGSIRALVEGGVLQMDLFDERNLLEITSPEYPGERLVACRNPALAQLRGHKREDLLAATERNLEKVKARVDAGKLSGADEIGLRVGKVINQYKVAKHLELSITDTALSWTRKADSIQAEAALDGLYIVRTSLKAEQMDSASCVRSYKSLSQVERAFRSIKTMDLKVRPIHHRLETRVRAHIFLCMLAYYVEWHMRETWRELMFADTEQTAKATRDPVAPAQRSESAQHKAAIHVLDSGETAHSWRTLMHELATLTRNTCRAPGAGADAPSFELITKVTATQQRALDLVQAIRL